MAGIFPYSSLVQPWIQADVFIFSEGVPEDPSQVQTLGTLPSSSLLLVLQVGPSSQQTPRGGGPGGRPKGIMPFLQLTLPFLPLPLQGRHELGLQKCQCKEEIKSRRMETQELQEPNSTLKNTNLLLSDQMFFHLCTTTAV